MRRRVSRLISMSTWSGGGVSALLTVLAGAALVSQLWAQDDSKSVAGKSGQPTATAPARRTPHDVLDALSRRESSGSQSATAPATRPIDRSSNEKDRRLKQYGGSRLTEDAVDAGLAWLAAHQNQDGRWDRLRFDECCPKGDKCNGVAVSRSTSDLDPGITGLVLLAFLGAGYTDREGPYQDCVSRGVAALLRMEQEGGDFGREDSQAGYNNAVAALALAEYLALTDDLRVEPALRRIIARLVSSQQTLGGWDYTPSPNTGRNDTSITAWVVQALHAAASAGIDVPRTTLIRAMLHFHRASEVDGRVWYADAGVGLKLDDDLNAQLRFGPAMTAAGMMCTQMLGWGTERATLMRQQALLFADPPSAAKARGRDTTQLHNEYYWYYATVAMFQRGGDDWPRWNGKLRDALLPLQDRTKARDGRKKHAFGSFPPFGENWGKWGRYGGRIYTTALCVLTLEIYYRNTPAYLKDDLLVSADDWRAFVAPLTAKQRRAAVDCLGELRVEISESALLDLLNDVDRGVALAAAEKLAAVDSPLGLPLIESTITALPPWERGPLEKAQKRARHVLSRPGPHGAVRLVAPELQLATLEMPGAWAGLDVDISRDGSLLARMRITQRFEGKSIVVAEIVSVETGALIQDGDVAAGVLPAMP